MPGSVADLEMEALRAITGLQGSMSDLEFAYYSSLSGLPVASSLTDHQKKYWETATGLNNKSMADLEKAFYDLEGIPAGSLADREYQYWGQSIPAAFVGGFGIQGGTTQITMPFAGVGGGPVRTNDMVLVFTCSKLSATDPGLPANWNAGANGAVGVGVDGVGTGLFKLEAFWRVLNTDTPTDPVIPIAGGNVALGNGIVFRASPNKIWTPPIFTIGSDVSHDVNYSAAGAANLNCRPRDVIAYMAAGTANTALTGGRALTLPGCTGVRQGVNSTGTATGNQLYCWEDYQIIATGVESGPPVALGTFGANQSGGTIFARIR